MGSESAGFQECSGDVVGEVAEAEGGAAEVLEPAVDGLGGTVGGTGPVRNRQDLWMGVSGGLLVGC